MKKLSGVAVFAIIVLGLMFSFSSVVRADNDNKRGNDDHERERKEIRASGSTLEVHINDNGKVLVRGAKVSSVSASSIMATTSWGTASVPWTVNISSNTEMNRRFGGKLQMSEISVGDFISFQGDLVQGSSGFVVNAKVVKNWSVQKVKADSFGSVSSINSTAQSFVLVAGGDRGTITVNVVSSTSIMKGDSKAVFADIKVGDKIRVNGLYNSLTKILEADKVKIYVEKIEQAVFEAKIKSISGTALPATFVVTLNGGADATVNIPAGISILNKNYALVALSDFRVNDSIRIYGSREGGVIDATVVRNVSLPR